MSSTKFFRFPWASSGDKATIPDTAPPDGAVSYPQGFGPDYERDPATDPLAKRVPRDETNQLYHDITSNLRAWQLAAVPEWVDASQNGGVAVTYPANALVRYGTSVFFATVETDGEPTVSADWSFCNLGFSDQGYRSITAFENDPPVSPSVNDEYVVGLSPTGDWAGHANQIAQWNGAAWSFSAPTPRMLVGVGDGTDWRWDQVGGAWVEWSATTSLRGPIKLASSPLVETNITDAVTPAQLLPLVTSGQNKTEAFTPGTRLSDLAGTGNNLAEAFDIPLGSTYCDIFAACAFRNTSAGLINMTMRVRLINNTDAVTVGETAYIGCANKDSFQTPVVVAGRFSGLDPTKQYILQQLVQKGTTGGPVNVLDTRLIVYHN